MCVVARSVTTVQGAVAQLVERFVRIEEVVVSITISSTWAVAFIPPQRPISFSSPPSRTPSPSHPVLAPSQLPDSPARFHTPYSGRSGMCGNGSVSLMNRNRLSRFSALLSAGELVGRAHRSPPHDTRHAWRLLPSGCNPVEWRSDVFRKEGIWVGQVKEEAAAIQAAATAAARVQEEAIASGVPAVIARVKADSAAAHRADHPAALAPACPHARRWAAACPRAHRSVVYRGVTASLLLFLFLWSATVARNTIRHHQATGPVPADQHQAAVVAATSSVACWRCSCCWCCC